jgi:hypothetical protein
MPMQFPKPVLAQVCSPLPTQVYRSALSQTRLLVPPLPLEGVDLIEDHDFIVVVRRQHPRIHSNCRRGQQGEVFFAFLELHFLFLPLEQRRPPFIGLYIDKASQLNINTIYF